MHRVLVIVPFPMSEENRRQRASQLAAVHLGPDIAFDFRPVRAAPANYTSEHDAAIAELSIVDAGMRCIEEDGADVILLGSTTMHQAHAYLAERLAVPVINPGPLTSKLAQAAIALRLSHSRRAFPRPLVPKEGMIDAMFRAAALKQ